METSRLRTSRQPTSSRTNSCSAAAEIAFIADHYIYTDHNQTITASAGLTYLWQGTRFSADMIFGSGLRSGDFNLDHVPAYRQVNLVSAHEFNSGLEKPATLRFDIMNLFDEVYEIREWIRHRGVRPAIRPTPRILGGPIAEVLKRA